MCCFSGPVKSVTNTNIFARLTGNSTQMLAYQMDFESAEDNAMILPIPVATKAHEDSLRFISLKKYDSLFADMDSAFPQILPASRADSFKSDPAAGAIDSELIVHEVGDFVASFVPTMNDFARLDQRFVIPKSSWDKIPKYADYGFAVFQLKSRKGKPHPMAFEFETRFTDQIFFPTVHIHDGEVHEREEFDHTLYLQNAAMDKVVGKYVNHHVKDRRTLYVRSKGVAKTYCQIEKAKGLIDPDLLFHRIKMVGKFQNQDVIAPVSGGFRLSQLRLLSPALLGLCGLNWLFNRRDDVRNLEVDA